MRLTLIILLELAGIACAVPTQRLNADERATRPRLFKNPLDVSVDQKGTTARVVLQVARKTAWVDLATGRVKAARASKVSRSASWESRIESILSRSAGKPLIDWSPSELSLHGPEDEVLHFVTIPDYHEFDAGFSLRAACFNSEFAKHKTSNFLTIGRYAKTNVPTTQVSQAWVFHHAISVDSTRIAALDEPNHGCADASDLIITPDGKLAFVASAGSDTILAIDVARLVVVVAKQAKKARTEHNPYPFDLTASRHFVIAKLPTQANPRRLGLSGDGKTLVVSNYLADSLTVIDVPSLKVVRHITLGSAKPDAARRGEILFNSARMTFQGQFTCASCHPNGGSDGLVWDLTRDGVGNFKKTKSLLGVKDTAPYGWHGSSPTLADRVSGTLRTLHRHEPRGTEVADIVAYLQTLPPPRPRPVPKRDRPAVDRGRALFLGKARCAACHRPPTLQDGKLHDIGTRGPTDTQDAFDTPSLRGLGDTHRYLHDGRTGSLEEVFTKFNNARRHGAVHRLSKAELADLLAYLATL
jgi:cytochrome c peroxidase